MDWLLCNDDINIWDAPCGGEAGIKRSRVIIVPAAGVKGEGWNISQSADIWPPRHRYEHWALVSHCQQTEHGDK